jgi:hypothetical protein
VIDLPSERSTVSESSLTETIAASTATFEEIIPRFQ